MRLAAAVDAGDATEPGEPGKSLESALAGLYAEAAVHTGAPDADEGMDRPTIAIQATARGDAGASAETRIAIGAPMRDGTTEAYFARIEGVDATFAVPRAVVSAILDAW